ncbi:histone-lysine N-methyltransferase SET9 [Phyllosticta citribraziliensis]|uniref:Histone-lysine N-methyltransferase SET9 n=1 Tax=Phyllosticta citribraziliensis TaxID=989973 RepID=A0ABR1L4T5_9PEZI
MSKRDKEAPLKEALAKKGGLTLSQLAHYDDLATDALVDKVYFWTTIRKNRLRYSSLRGLNDEKVADLLRQKVIIGKDPAKALQLLLEEPALKRNFQRLGTNDEREHFKRHLRKYINIYMPDCPWEVATTNRYTITQHEAAVYARKDIRKHEVIKYLCGIQVALTQKEEEKLDVNKSDFSIVRSSRKKTSSLFLGPARFANHDCEANARLTTNGPNGMTIVSVREIESGQEITVSYGDDYFGEDNCECLCATCEKYQRNGWDPARREESEEAEEKEDDAQDEEDAVEDEEAAKSKEVEETEAAPDVNSASGTPYSSRKKRNTQTDDTTTSAQHVYTTTSTQTDDALWGQDRGRKRRNSTNDGIKKVARPRQRHSVSSMSFQEAHGAAYAKLTTLRNQHRFHGSVISESDSLSTDSPASYDSSPPSSDSTAATSADGEAAAVGFPASRSKTRPGQDAAGITIHVDSSAAEGPSSTPISTSISELSEMSDNVAFDDANQRLVHHERPRTPPRTRSRSHNKDLPPTSQPAAPIPTIESSSGSAAAPTAFDPNRRVPGDYTLTPLLLCAKYSRWVSCRTCDGDFVQEDAYLTRAACPRCERHSKLYGYAWPKTEKDGRWDTEERVLDHREIHRFIPPDEEREMRKGRKNLAAEMVRRHGSAAASEARERDGSLRLEPDSESGEGTPRRATRRTRSRLSMGTK